MITATIVALTLIVVAILIQAPSYFLKKQRKEWERGYLHFVRIYFQPGMTQKKYKDTVNYFIHDVDNKTTSFEEGALFAINQIQNYHNRYKKHLQPLIDDFNGEYLKCAYEPKSPGCFEQTICLGRQLVNELLRSGLVDDSYHKILEERGYSHESTNN